VPRLAPAIPLDEILERDWDRDLFGKKGLATMLGWESQWTFLSKGSRAGYPDRTCCRERIVFVELKRELTGRLSEDRKRQPTDAQVAWLDRLATAGGEVYLWRPSDLDEIARVLSKWWKHDHGTLVLPSGYSAEPRWTPNSLWIPGVGRADTTEQQSLLTKGAVA
jgi:hypothetical protein